ncbi:hypothetical protein [Aliamphritea spongicola]|nr:hypothetical protein [Aliamphritea spongicola]
MRIYRPLGLVNIQRYQKINIYANSPEEVYPANASLDVADNCQFCWNACGAFPW